jgi:hypothetical protein
LLLAVAGGASNARLHGVIWSKCVQLDLCINYIYKNKGAYSSKKWQRYPDEGYRLVSPEVNDRNRLSFSELEEIFKTSSSEATNSRSLDDGYKQSKNVVVNSLQKVVVDKLPKYIDGIKSLNFTRAGKIQLLGLTASGINYADRKMQSYRNKSITNLFKLFEKIAVEEGGCKPDRLKIVENWMMKEYISPIDPLFENTHINTFAFAQGRFTTTGMIKEPPRYKTYQPPKDPYYRSQENIAICVQLRHEREVILASMETDELNIINKRVQEMRAYLGINDDGSFNECEDKQKVAQ